MISLIFDHNYYKDLYGEYKKERETFENFLLLANILGYGSLLIYIALLIFLKTVDLRFVALDLFSIYTRFSIIILHKYYEVPSICTNLFSEDEKLVTYSYKTINAHRKEILGCLWINLFGLGYDRTLLDAKADKIQHILSERSETNWKNIGFFYLIKYCFVTIFLLIFIIYISLYKY
jgi:hypothetical protein